MVGRFPNIGAKRREIDEAPNSCALSLAYDIARPFHVDALKGQLWRSFVDDAGNMQSHILSVGAASDLFRLGYACWPGLD